MPNGNTFLRRLTECSEMKFKPWPFELTFRSPAATPPAYRPPPLRHSQSSRAAGTSGTLLDRMAALALAQLGARFDIKDYKLTFIR
jgi:hypothetical protein